MVSKVLVYAASVLSEQGVDVILATMLSQEGAREFLAVAIQFLFSRHGSSTNGCGSIASSGIPTAPTPSWLHGRRACAHAPLSEFAHAFCLFGTP